MVKISTSAFHKVVFKQCTVKVRWAKLMSSTSSLFVMLHAKKYKIGKCSIELFKKVPLDT